MLAHVDHESWKLGAGGVIAALMGVCICPFVWHILCFEQLNSEDTKIFFALLRHFI